MSIPRPCHASDPDYKKGVALVLLAGSMWSIAGLLIRLMEHALEWQILFYRSLALMFTLLCFIGLTSRGAWFKVFKAAGISAVVGGVFLGSTYASWIFAMTHTTIANALFILASAPFMTAAIAWVVLRETVRPVTIVCMFVAMAGIGVMVADGIMGGRLSGNIFALIAAFGFSVFTVVLRRSKSVDMTPTVFWSGFWGALIGMTMTAISDIGFSVTHRDLALCALMGVVQVGVGLIIFTMGSKYVPSAELVLLSLTEVILGPIWVWLGVGEVPGVYTLLGGSIVLTAIVTQALSGIQRNRTGHIVINDSPH